MSIRRAILPVILTLGAAGSILAGSVVPVVSAQAPSAHVLVTASATPNYVYQG
jgi:hypothetical protein